MKQERAIKVQPFIRPAVFKRPRKITSLIRLQGDWLKAAGFEPGDVVTLRIEPGKIVIM